MYRLKLTILCDLMQILCNLGPAVSGNWLNKITSGVDQQVKQGMLTVSEDAMLEAKTNIHIQTKQIVKSLVSKRVQHEICQF